MKQDAADREVPQGSDRDRVSPITCDPASRALATTLTEYACADRSLLLTGEIGSGKSVLGRLVHQHSAKREGCFVQLSCAGLGNAKSSSGEFDDLVVSQVLARAREGTIFLDEVGDLPKHRQEHLLQWLNCPESKATRVISSTHRDLTGLVERGAFLAALVERLVEASFEVPALRDRPEDIIPLALHFLADVVAAPPVQLSAGAIARLRSYSWPGNVLELRNAIERAVRLAGEQEILTEHLPSEGVSVGRTDRVLRERVDSVKRDAIIKALADRNYNQTHSARHLGPSRRALIYKMEKYGLKPPPGASGR
ncbi:MAG: sigma 54-interacting transcriptional regulator [Myxococcota bacterium]